MSTSVVKVPATTYTRSAYVDRWGHRHPASRISKAGYTRKAGRRKRKKTTKSDRWYQPKVEMDWRKDTLQKPRKSKELVGS